MLAAMPMQVVATSQRRNFIVSMMPEPRRHASAGRVDVELDVGLGIIVGEEQHLRDDRVGRFIGHRAAEHDDAVLEQAGVNVIRPLPAAGLFDHDGDQCVAWSCSPSGNLVAVTHFGYAAVRRGDPTWAWSHPRRLPRPPGWCPRR